MGNIRNGAHAKTVLTNAAGDVRIEVPRDRAGTFDPDVEIRRIVFSIYAIESLNARYRKAIAVRGHFPTEQNALKTLCLVTRGMDPTGTGQARRSMRWMPALNAFAVTFADRMPAADTL